MIASELITYDIPPLKISDNGEKALNWMEEFKVNELPVIKGNLFVGLLSEDDVLDQNSSNLVIKDYPILLNRIFAYNSQHVFEVMEIMAKNQIFTLPIIDNKEKYIGIVNAQSILNYLANSVSIKSPGSIFTLSLSPRDYSLSEISKLVESDDAKITSVIINSSQTVSLLEVTIKVNKTEISRILNTFERFNYDIIASYSESDYHEDLKSRYDEFMRYLNT